MIRSYRKVSFLILTFMLSGCVNFLQQSFDIGQFANQSPEQIYQQANSSLKAGKYHLVVNYARAFIYLYPQHEKAESAYIILIDAYCACGQFEQAIQTTTNFLLRYPDSVYRKTLENKMVEIKKKQKIDSFYHVAWLRDIKSQNKLHYRILTKQVKRPVSTGNLVLLKK